MDRLICHVIPSCRECTWKRRGMQARRTAEDEAPSSYYWWWWWWGGGRWGRDSMLDIVLINLSEVLPPSPLPYPSFLTLPPSSRPIDEQWFTNKQKPPPMSRQNALTSWPINWNYHHPPPLQPSLSPPPALPTTVIWGRAHHGNVFSEGGSILRFCVGVLLSSSSSSYNY